MSFLTKKKKKKKKKTFGSGDGSEFEAIDQENVEISDVVDKIDSAMAGSIQAEEDARRQRVRKTFSAGCCRW